MLSREILFPEVDPNPFNPDFAWNGDNAGGAVSKIYPVDIISINLNDPEYINFMAVDMAGRNVWKEGKKPQKGLNTLSIVTSTWKNGTYIFNIASKEGLLNYSQKVMIGR